jgi:hypothetical protein
VYGNSATFERISLSRPWMCEGVHILDGAEANAAYPPIRGDVRGCANMAAEAGPCGWWLADLGSIALAGSPAEFGKHIAEETENGAR